MEDKVLSKVVLSGTIKEWAGKIKFCFVLGRAAELLLPSPELMIRQRSFCAQCRCLPQCPLCEVFIACLVEF